MYNKNVSKLVNRIQRNLNNGMPINSAYLAQRPGNLASIGLGDTTYKKVKVVGPSVSRKSKAGYKVALPKVYATTADKYYQPAHFSISSDALTELGDFSLSNLSTPLVVVGLIALFCWMRKKHK